MMSTKIGALYVKKQNHNLSPSRGRWKYVENLMSTFELVMCIDLVVVNRM